MFEVDDYVRWGRFARLKTPEEKRQEKRDSRPIIIVDGLPKRLREGSISFPVDDPFFGLPGMVMGKEQVSAFFVRPRYELQLVTTSGEVITGDYDECVASQRDSGRWVYCFGSTV